MTPATLRRIKLILHYDGADFHGWQLQPRVRTVQGEVEAALERLTGRETRVTASGRTDRGVHATGQVAAAEVAERWSARELRRALNAVLPDDIWVEGAEAVSGDFHPRYDAVARTYTYRLGTAPDARSPFHRRWCWPLVREVDADLLRHSAALLPGRRSFAAFAKSGQPERGEMCTVHDARWERWEPLGHRFRITADRYLHHMVRYLVGTMVEVGRGRRPPEEFRGLLGGESDLVTSRPAPPEGLFLTRVRYPGGDGAGSVPAAGAAEAAGSADEGAE